MATSVYKTWFEISLLHEYYVKDSCKVLIDPSIETKLFFKKSNILFWQQSNNKWLILKEKGFDENDLLNEEPILLSFELHPTDAKFYYVSGKIKMNETFLVKETDRPKIWKIIESDIRKFVEKGTARIDIEIEALNKYYEYILIPKFHTIDTNIKLVESRNRILFNDAERITGLPGIAEALRFVSKEKIKLTDENDFKVQLWEIKESGERLISDHISNPQPNQISILNSKDVLTTYFYY